MGLYVNKNDQRSELQKRIADELQAKARDRKKKEDESYPDGVSDSAYIKNTSESPLGVLITIIVAAVALLALVLYLIFK